MKKGLFANVSLAVLGFVALGIASASAADLPRQRAMPVKAPEYVSPAYNWTGFYLGINGGYGWTGSGNGGGVVGPTVGYNFQTGPWVYGLEGDYDWTNINGSPVCGGLACSTSNHWLATARGRVGYAMGATGSVLPYVTGGAAFGDIKNTVAGVGSLTGTKTGWTLGGGLEAAISGPLTAKIEYLYVDLGNGPTVAGIGSSFHSNIIRAGLNYRF
jgi:outer membrane immunogenic protein